MSSVPKVLIVDDDHRMCDSLNKLLSSQRYELETSNSAKEAIDNLKKDVFDLVLLDIVMPDENGYKVMDYIIGQSLDTSVIIMTGHASTESAIKALRKGAYDYLKKPFEPEKLLATVKNTLNHYRLKSEGKQIKEALLQSEEKYRQLFATVSDAIMIFDSETREFIDINDSCLSMYGYSRGEFLKLKHTDITDEPEKSRESINQALSGEITKIPLRFHKRKDGTVFPIEISIGTFKLGNRQMICGVIRDISYRKQVENELRENEERLKEAQIISHIGNWDRNIKTGEILWSDEQYRIWGYEPGEVIPTYELVKNHLYPDDLKRFEEAHEAAFYQQKPYDYEYRIVRKDGVVRVVHSKAEIIFDATGEPIRHFGTLQDITERKQAEENLRKEFRMRTTLLDNIPGCIALILKKGTREIVASNRFAREFGAVPGQTCFKTCAMRDDNCPFCLAPKLWTTGQSQRREVEYRGTWYEGIWAPLSEDLYVHYIFDITERKLLEQQLHQAHKMEALGTLTGGIAHDFNNLLYIIMGNISMAKDDVKLANGIAEFLNEAEKASLKAKELANQLITFSKGGAPVKKTGPIGDLVKGTTYLSRRGSNVKSELIFPDDLWLVEFDEGQMKHAVKNIIDNAVESMPDGGSIAVKAENINIRPETVEKSLPLLEGKYVKISTKDHGVGIPEEHLSKIFDPYFSTKEKGTQKGMGLGLAITYSIISKHDGHIAVESEVGVGTTFIIYLPAAVKEIVDIEPVKMVEPEKPAVCTGRILVMDDEGAIRKLYSQSLSRLGYEPEMAKDGAEAIELYKRAMDSGKPFDTVILDLTIKGGAGGKEVIKQLIKIDPDIKAIVSSGYSSDPVMTNFRAYGFIGALPKPYAMKDLKDMLSKIIME